MDERATSQLLEAPATQPAPAPLGKKAKPVGEHRSFLTDQDAFTFLKFEAQAIDHDEELISSVAQDIEDHHKTRVLVTGKRILIIKTFAHEQPFVVSFENPKAIEVTADGNRNGSTLTIQAKKKYVVEHLGPGDAHRVADIVRLMRFGRLEESSPIPSSIAFDNVMPIEYYEAKLGPDSQMTISEHVVGDRIYALEVITGDRHGMFQVVQYRQNGADRVEMRNETRPFRENQTQLVQEDSKPYRIYVHADPDSDVDSLLSSLNIKVRRKAATIEERYVAVERVPTLDAVLKVLRHAGLKQGKAFDDFDVVQGNELTYLTLRGGNFTFDKEGNPVVVRKVHGKIEHAVTAKLPITRPSKPATPVAKPVRRAPVRPAPRSRVPAKSKAKKTVTPKRRKATGVRK